MGRGGERELATGEEGAAERGVAATGGDRFAPRILKHAAVTPHAGLVAEAVTVRTLVVAT
ncbi:MAG: hypothetical protein ACI9MX_001005 [Candidatus Aldehydirespiratoraceae bacterium]|jgi:hypothetical protein